MELTTPALLFPAISLLLLAYSNRFLVLAQLIRQLHGKEQDQVRDIVIRQIANLSQRVQLVRLMQALGVLSFFICTLSMFALFVDFVVLAKWLFGASLVLLALSLFVSLWEITISTHAISIELEDIKNHIKKPRRNGRQSSDNKQPPLP